MFSKLDHEEFLQRFILKALERDSASGSTLAREAEAAWLAIQKYLQSNDNKTSH